MARRPGREAQFNCYCPNCDFHVKLSASDLGFGMVCPECHVRTIRPVRRINASPISLQVEQLIVLGVSTIALSFGFAAVVNSLVPNKDVRLLMMARTCSCLTIAVVALVVAGVTVVRYVVKDGRQNRAAAENERVARRAKRDDERRPNRRRS